MLRSSSCTMYGIAWHDTLYHACNPDLTKDITNVAVGAIGVLQLFRGTRAPLSRALDTVFLISCMFYAAIGLMGSQSLPSPILSFCKQPSTTFFETCYALLFADSQLALPTLVRYFFLLTAVCMFICVNRCAGYRVWSARVNSSIDALLCNPIRFGATTTGAMAPPPTLPRSILGNGHLFFSACPQFR